MSTRAKSDTRLVAAFSGLTDAQMRRLLWHRKNKTPVLCGPNANHFVRDGEA